MMLNFQNVIVRLLWILEMLAIRIEHLFGVHMNEIIPNLFVGDFADAKSDAAKDMFILCVLEQKPSDEPANATWIPFLEGDKANHTQLDAIAAVIDAQLSAGRKVLTHCGAGIERSPLAVVWFLHAKRGMSIGDAYKLVIEKKPQAQRREVWL